MIAVVLKENNKLIGNVYLGKREFESLELGYVFNKQYWGEGYAKESCDALIRKAFSEGVHFKKNVYFRKDENGNPIWKDTFVYSLLSHTYSERRADEF